MIAVMTISSTPQQKAFSIPVDQILHLSTDCHQNHSECRVTEHCRFHQLLSDFSSLISSLPCAQRGEKSLILLKETRSTAWSLHLWTTKVAAEQAIPSCCSRMHWACPTEKCFFSWKVTSDFPSWYSACDAWHPESNWYFAVDKKAQGFCH